MYRMFMSGMWTALIGMILLTSCAPASGQGQTDSANRNREVRTPVEPLLEDRGVAPELQNEVWLNVEAPLRMADLRGKVVLLDFWTFG